MASSGPSTQDSTFHLSPVDSSQQNEPFIPEDDSTPTPTDANEIHCTDESEEVLTLGCKRGLKSQVWNHYKRQKLDGKWKAECIYCKKKLGGDTRNGTTHLHDHFKICPLRTTRDIKQTFLRPKKNVDGKVAIGTYSFDEEVARKEMATMIILHEYPLNMVEHLGFRRFVSSLQPLFKVVCRNTLKGDILKIYEYERSKTMKFLDKNKSRVAITTDMWTSSNQKKGFMAITTHFIDESWKLQSRIIRFIYVPCPHTSDVIGDVLVDCLMDWNLDQKLSTLTVDNCSTNDAVINYILNKLDTSSLWLEGSLLHMRCCAHILNLIVKDGLEVIGDGIERIRTSVAFWVATPKRCERFEETVRQLKIPFTKKLVLDCKTRWNSTYAMLSIAICYKDVFTRLKQREPLYKCVPVEEDWERAKEICDKLKLFNSVTEIFSGTKYPTANLYFPKICEIRMALRRWLVCGHSNIEAMAAKMLDKFDKYWSQIHGIMGVATVLDPRYKLKLLHYYFPLLYGDDEAKKEIERIQELCSNLVAEYSSKLKMSGHGGSSYQSSISHSFTSFEEVDPMSGYDRFVASDSKNDSVKTEFDLYLEERVIPRKVDFDILSWWKNALKYPTLQLIARDVLSIPISTVASESAFSTSGRFVSPHRSRLHHDTLEALMCAQDWLWAEINDTCAPAHSGGCTFYEDIDEEEDGYVTCVDKSYGD